MIIISDLSTVKSRDFVELECEVCHKNFWKMKKRVLEALKGKLRTKFDKCSSECYDRQIKKVECGHCGKFLMRRCAELRRTKKSFCSHSCTALYGNSHKTSGNRRSKMEIWIENQLKAEYPVLEFHFNRRDAIHAELDIYVPRLQLAFELNGIFHYEPIFGKEKLDKTQNNDKRKFQACLEHGIELCIIDTSKVKYFKEDNYKQFLLIIINLINSKLDGSTPKI